MDFPNDPMMLLSVVNTRLRDFYPSLKLLCDDNGLDLNELKEKLSAIGYEYDEELNRFV